MFLTLKIIIFVYFVTDVKIIIANIEFKCHEIYNICWNLSDY